MSNPTHDQHFVPVFYLKNWVVAPEGRLVEYKRRADGIIRPRWTGPKGTGYERFLYEAVDGSAPSLESSFFMPADSCAAEAMSLLMRTGSDLCWTSSQRSSWSRFIMSMLIRHPDDIAELKRLVEDDWTNVTDEMREHYQRNRQEGMPVTVEELWETNRSEYREVARLQWLRSMVDNRGVGRHINSMSWNVVNVSNGRYSLLISDKPIFINKNLGDVDAFIMMPLTPSKLFIAVKRVKTLEVIESLYGDGIVTEVNREVVRNARRFVFASNKDQTRFVLNHFGLSNQPTWMMRLAEKRANERLAQSAA